MRIILVLFCGGVFLKPVFGNLAESVLLHEESKLPKSNLYQLHNGVLEGGYNIAGNNNDASGTKDGGAVALNTNYAASVQFSSKPNGGSNTQTSSTTGVNAALQLPVASQKLLNKYGNKAGNNQDAGVQGEAVNVDNTDLPQTKTNEVSDKDTASARVNSAMKIPASTQRLLNKYGNKADTSDDYITKNGNKRVNNPSNGNSLQTTKNDAINKYSDEQVEQKDSFANGYEEKHR